MCMHDVYASYFVTGLRDYQFAAGDQAQGVYCLYIYIYIYMYTHIIIIIIDVYMYREREDVYRANFK